MAALLDDYSDAFDPEWSLERLSRGALARLCREYMLVSMFHDRALMPHIVEACGQDATIRHADTEWMSASPVYTARNKWNLGIAGDGVGECFKSFQFDIGCPHHFLDFRYDLVDHDLGYFWLPFCGAHDYLRELTGNDPTLVTNMCHHMEDRTFDATLGVTNPRARAIPIHRPPKPDELTGDHCRWEVRIVAEEPGARPGEPTLDIVTASRAGQLQLVLGDDGEAGGLRDYSGEFRPDLRLEDLSHAVLVRQAKEFSLDVHLLMRAGYLSVDENFGMELLDRAAPQHLAAIAPPLVARLRDALQIAGDDMFAVAKILQINPLMPDDYVDYRLEVDDSTTGRLLVRPSAGLDDDVCRSPLSWLREPEQPGFEHIAQAVNPRLRLRPLDPERHEAALAWELTIDPAADPVEPNWAAELVNGGRIAGFDLRAREVPVTIGGPTRPTPTA